MQLNLPADLANRLQQFTSPSGEKCSEIDVIRRALDSLDHQEQERKAIQEGIEDYKAGKVRDFDEFDRDFQARHGFDNADS